MIVDKVQVYVDDKDFSAEEVKYFVELAKSRLSDSEDLKELEISQEGARVILKQRGVFEKTERFVKPKFAGV